MLSVNGARLLERINELGTIGKDEEGRRTRLAASDTVTSFASACLLNDIRY